MKRTLLILIFAFIACLNTYAQGDSTKAYKVIVGIPDITSDEFTNIVSLVKSSTIFGFTFYCAKERVLVLESNMELTKEEVEMLFSPAIEKEKIFYKEVNVDMSNFCEANSDNKVIKQ